ncbi:hypothetical protein J6590_089893 [Homalodisca vitripennis]|nr:hypothetical protein J6590_089893 [Homalodisca vitripennis]
MYLIIAKNAESTPLAPVRDGKQFRIICKTSPTVRINDSTISLDDHSVATSKSIHVLCDCSLFEVSKSLFQQRVQAGKLFIDSPIESSRVINVSSVILCLGSFFLGLVWRLPLVVAIMNKTDPFTSHITVSLKFENSPDLFSYVFVSC